MASVNRRLVIYISGLDPRGARHYRNLFTTELTKWCDRHGRTATIGERESLPDRIERWPVQGDAMPDLDYQFWGWDDVIRDWWPKRRLAMLARTLKGGWQGLRLGLFGNSLDWSWPLLVTIAIAPLMLVALPLLWLLLTLAVLATSLSPWLQAGLIVIFAGLLMLCYRRLNARFQLDWIGCGLPFHGDQVAGRVPGLDDRFAAFADHLAQLMNDPHYDEILVVGHSMGCAPVVQLVHDALQRCGPRSAGAPRLTLVTLGQVIPLLAWYPRGARIRAAVAALAHSTALDWIDISSPPDGACFALTDPATVIDVPLSTRSNPKLINARFHEALSTARYAEGKRNRMFLHFQYIMASDRPAGYDYFDMITDPRPVPEQFADRPSVRDFVRLRRPRLRSVR